MALSGNLRDFSLPDVFQLVSFSRKTGTLAIDRADAKGFVYFRDGEVFFAISNWHREPMGRRLVAADKVTDRQLKRALELQGSDPERRRLGQILVDEGYLSPQVLETFVQEQIQDTIFDLFRWEEGEFDFKAGVIPTDEDIGLSVSVENVIMEGSRRLEEWSRIRKKIPSDDAVFRMATAPGEGTFEIGLRASEWKLLCLLDGRRTVAQLSGLLDLSDFEVSRILYGMFSGGLLEREGGDDAGEQVADVSAVPEASVAQEPAAEAPIEPEVAAPDAAPAEEVAEPATEQAVPEEEPVAEAVPQEEIVAEAVPEAAEVQEEAIGEASEDEGADVGDLADAVLGEVGEATEDGAVGTLSPAEAASAGPTTEQEEAGAPPAPAEFEEETVDLLAESLGEDDELEAGDFDLTDELAALTGTSESKSKKGHRQAGAAPPKPEVALHVDKRVDKALLAKLIDGVKRL